MRRPLGHPRRRHLQAWLELGDPRIDDHVATCHRCADVIERLDEGGGPIGDALLAILSPPADLHPRLQSGIAAKMQTRNDLRLLVELLGLPVQTLRAMGPHDPPPRPDAQQ